MGTYQNIKINVEDRVARISLARPPLNVFNIAMMRELAAAVQETANQDIVAIVFEADKETRAFSAGVAVEEHAPETVYPMPDRSIGPPGLEQVANHYRYRKRVAAAGLKLIKGANRIAVSASFGNEKTWGSP